MTSKLRVHELAKELGVSSKELLTALKEQGEFVKSASSTIEAPVARHLRKSFGTPRPASVHAKRGARPASPLPNTKQDVAVISAVRTPTTSKIHVHALAKELGVSSKELLTALKEQGEFVKSASSIIEAPVARRLRETFTIRPTSPPQSCQMSTPRREVPPPIPLPPRPVPGPRPFPPRPAPKPCTRAPATLPSTQLVTVSEAYAIVGVRPEAIRKWASRGYLQSIGKRGRAALYDRDDLLRVRNETRSRTIDPAVSSELYVPHSHYNRLITTDEVARLFSVAPSTVRSWVRRGHLTPIRRGARGWLFKIGLVLIAADDRRRKFTYSR